MVNVNTVGESINVFGPINSHREGARDIAEWTDILFSDDVSWKCGTNTARDRSIWIALALSVTYALNRAQGKVVCMSSPNLTVPPEQQSMRMCKYTHGHIHVYTYGIVKDLTSADVAIRHHRYRDHRHQDQHPPTTTGIVSVTSDREHRW